MTKNKNLYVLMSLPFLLLVLLCYQPNAGADSSSTSKLETSISLYNEGKLQSAFDGFVDVSVSGTLEEQKVADSYLKKIRQDLLDTAVSTIEPEKTQKNTTPTELPAVKETPSVTEPTKSLKTEPETKVIKTKAVEQTPNIDLKEEPSIAGGGFITSGEIRLWEEKEQSKKLHFHLAGVSSSYQSAKLNLDSNIAKNDFRDAVADEPIVVVGEKAENETEYKLEEPEDEVEKEARDRALDGRTKVDEMRDIAITALKYSPGVKIWTKDKKLGIVTVRTPHLFSKDSMFNTNAGDTLTKLATAIITSSQTFVHVFPEHMLDNQMKVIDIKRAMAVNLFLQEKGLSPARIKVHMGNASVIELPRLTADMKNGIMFFFDYNQKPNLTVDGLSENVAPEVSLSIYPSAIRTYMDEIAIMEFSVRKTSSKISYWKFEIFPAGKESLGHPVYESKGEESVYQQIHWDAKGPMGSPFKSGKYSCVLTAFDVDGRENVVKRGITVGTRDVPLVTTQKAKGASKAVMTPKSKLGPSKAMGEDVLEIIEPSSGSSNGSDLMFKSIGLNDSNTRSAISDNPVDLKKSSLTTKPQTYKIGFNDGTTTLKSSSFETLEQLASAMKSWPMTKLSIKGVANFTETGSEYIAYKRAQMVSKLLNLKYGIDTDRLLVNENSSAGEDSAVEVQVLNR
jgi:outer membrane protein OmpA-like peptidoglycan-associated protein